MLITSLLIATKLVSAPAKAMVTLEYTRKITTNLINASRQFISSSLNNEHQDQNNTTNNGNQNAAPTSTEYLVHNWLEARFAWIQMIILWHEPLTSMIAISSFLGFFLLIPQFELKLYPTILIVVFVYNLTKVWFRYVWPEIRVKPQDDTEQESLLDVNRWTHLHPQLMTIAECRQMTSNLIEHIRKTFLNLLAIRREKPIGFSIGMLLTFFATATIGREITGFTLILSITSVLILAPGIYLHLLPKSIKDYLNQNLSDYIIQPPKTHTQSESDQDQMSSQSTIPTSHALIEPATTTINQTPATISLFDHLKQVSFLTSQYRDPTITKDRPRSEPVVIKTPNKKTVIGEGGTRESIVAQEEGEVSSSSSSSGRRYKDEQKSTDDLSSNESTSLIDFEDDQHDGFVIL